MVAAINEQAPDFVCFGGDLIEDRRHLPAALQLLAGIKAPLYGVPGNHDYKSRASFRPYFDAFAATGGAFLINDYRDLPPGGIRLVGLACNRLVEAPLPLFPHGKTSSSSITRPRPKNFPASNLTCYWPGIRTAVGCDCRSSDRR